MNEEEMNYLDAQQGVATGVAQQAQANAQAQYYIQESEKNLAETQLEVESITSRIYHLLQQDVFKPAKPNEPPEWLTISDLKNKTLTDWGVDRIMQSVHFYINKNTLLSNFDDNQIKSLMLRFTTELNDLVLLKYEKLFREPTVEECIQILESRATEKKKIRDYVAKIIGNPKAVQEIEVNIEYEINKIKNEQRKEKLREYGLLMAQLEAMVYATYNRAWKGEERGSIRRHQQVSEVIGGMQPSGYRQQQDRGGMFRWLR